MLTANSPLTQLLVDEEQSLSFLLNYPTQPVQKHPVRMFYNTRESQKVNEMTLLYKMFLQHCECPGGLEGSLPRRTRSRMPQFSLWQSWKIRPMCQWPIFPPSRYITPEPGDTAVSIYFTLGGQAVSTLTNPGSIFWECASSRIWIFFFFSSCNKSPLETFLPG